ncbi:MAG: hypothetical protein WCA81_19295 [Rhizomicrobium sp.]
MPRVSAAFFTFGALCVLPGMVLGMQMGATEDFRLAAAHAHINLVGWVTMALYGTFYALTSATMSARLAWTNFAVSVAGLLLMIPPLILLLLGNKNYIGPMVAGEMLTAVGLVIFLISVLRELFRKRA